MANSTNTLDDLQRNATAVSEALALWQAKSLGPLSIAAGSSQFGFIRIPNASAFFEQFGVEDPSAGPTSAHIEHIPTVSRIDALAPLLVRWNSRHRDSQELVCLNCGAYPS